MTITKRDISDISLVWIAFRFIPYLFNYVVQAVLEVLRPDPYVGLPMAVDSGYSKVYFVLIPVGELFVMAAFFWFLLFKRNLVLNRLFPGSEDKALELSGDSTEKLTDYSFWITIFGLFTGIHSGIQLISNFFRVLSTSNNSMGYFQYVWSYCGLHIISVILSVLVIWKANEIASFLSRLSDKPRNTESITEK